MDPIKPVGPVASAFGLLELLVGSAGALSLAEIARRSGHPRSSAHRILASLIQLGYVQQEQPGQYRTTFKLVEMGMEVLSSIDIVKVARRHLEALVQATNENAYLAVLDRDGNSIYLARVETSRAVCVHSQLGMPNPSWSTATGRAMLAFLPEVQKKVFARRLKAVVPSTVTDRRTLRAELHEVERRGVAVVRAQISSDTGGIAAPIRDFSGTVVASCGIAIPLHRMSERLVTKSIPAVVRAARAISVGLGIPATCERQR
ncbi:MAG: IclR family transcriptional regulator [Burkholderiaceae bacterium]|nr:IclR family transcriptional regulator [Burkholderiaceae bacterium]